MACMSHECVSCNWAAFNNSRGPSSCPKCGGEVTHLFDEDPREYEPDDGYMSEGPGMEEGDR